MKDNAALIALGAALAGGQRGTPAGNAGLTQEQLTVMRERRLTMADITLLPVMVQGRPPCPGAIPAQHQLPVDMVEMPCPVLGQQLMAPGLMRPLILLPDGRLASPYD